MQKIPTIFRRNPARMSEVLDEVNDECQWVFDGEGVPTQKLDGTCCMIRGGVLFKRYELKPRRGKVPDGFEAAQEADPMTGKQPGWLPVGDGPEDRYHREALQNLIKIVGAPMDGTYELCGPKIQGNPEGRPTHLLTPHGIVNLPDHERTYECIRAFLAPRDIEGIVYHHSDGRMAKIKKRDFGLRR